MPRRLAVLSCAAALLFAAGCSAASSGGGSGASTALTPSAPASSHTGPSSPPGSSAAADACAPGALKTKRSGALTVATDSPAYAPWFVDDKPTNGKGFESAVAFAVAKQLGFPASAVTWVKAPFNSVIAPTPKNFDVDINQVSITAARAKVVDFSSGYYDVAQAVIAFKKDKFSTVTSVAALRGAKLGAQKGTTSLDAINNQIKPTRTVSEFPTNALAVQALKNGQIDGLVVDLPTGLYLTAAELSGAKIIGQLPSTGTPEQFGMVLEKGSALTSCVTKAVDALRADGTLSRLQKQWLTTAAGAPELK